MNRTDIHAPSTFSPAEYRYLGSLYFGPDADAWENSPELLAAVRNSAFKGNFAAKATCDHCGAHFNYGEAFEHVNGDVIVVGHICANEAFGYDSRREYELARMKKATELSRERGVRATRVARFLEANPGLGAALEVDHPIIADINGKLIKYGDLSHKQVSFVFRLAAEVAQKADRQAERDAEPKIAVIPGRREITATILGTKVQDSQFGIQFKMLVRCTDGQKLWSTIPASVVQTVGNEPVSILRGRTIRFTGTVQVSDRDACFGFVSRPSKASIVETSVAA